MPLKIISSIVIFFLLNSPCSKRESASGENEPLRTFAAASLSTVLPKVAEIFEKEMPDLKIEFSFAASSILAKQIEQGAPADIYFSANSEWVAYLEQKNLIKPNSRMDLLGNLLVLIVPEKEKIPNLTLQDLNSAKVTSIALGDWSHVPAGIYARQALEKLGLWQQIEPKCIPALDVRAALTYVARGEADCGIVYRTDAYISDKVVIAQELSEKIQPRIVYPVVILRDSRHPRSEPFCAFLQSPAAKRVFEQAGFLVLTDD